MVRELSRRRMLGGVALAALGSALAACGQAATPTAAPAAKPTEAAKPASAAPTAGAAKPAADAKPAAGATQPAAAPAKGSGPVKLTVGSWSSTPEAKDWITGKLVAGYQQQNPSATVEMVWHDVTKINEQLLAAFAAGTAPDLFQGGISTFQAYYGAQGRVRDLAPYVKDWPVREDYIEAAWRVGQYDGKQFGLTQTQDVQVLFYRKDFFREAGLDPEKPPTTWEEARDYARKLVKRDGDKITRAGYFLPTQSFTGVQGGWWPYVFQNGGGLLSADMTKAAIDSPESVAGMTFYRDMLYTDKLDAVGGIPTGSQASPIAAGTAAMGTFGSAAAINDMKQLNPDKYNELAAALPLKKAKQASFLGGTQMLMTTDSKNPDEAWRFLSFWNSPDNLSQYAQASRGLPPLKSLIDKPPIKGDKLFETALRSSEFGNPWPSHPKHADYRLKIVAMSEAFMLNQKSVQQAASETAREINEILSKP